MCPDLQGSLGKKKQILKSIILQGGNSLQASQYRPITVPSNILGLITSRMCRKMSDIVERHGLLSEAQFGFRKGRSTVDAIFVLTSLLQKAKKKGRPYAVAFLDISKVWI